MAGRIGYGDFEQFRSDVERWLKTSVPSELRGLAKTGWLLGLREIDRSNLDVLKAWQKKVYEAGLLGISWPVAYGGYGQSALYELIAFEAFIDAEVPYGGLGSGLSIVAPALLIHGTEEQRRKYLPRMLTAADIWCQGFSEPGAGSDLASITTSATAAEGDVFLVNGQKTWSSFAGVSTHMILLARTGQDRHGGLTMFVVDPFPRDGIEIVPIQQITRKKEFDSVYFDSVRLDKAHTIGGVGEGWTVAMAVLSNERVHTQLPLIVNAEKVVRALQEKGCDVNDLGLEVAAVRMLYSKVARRGGTGADIGSRSSMLKIATTSILQRVLEAAVESAQLKDLMTEGWFQMFLASRAFTIAGGTSEILKNLVAERLLRLPK